LPLEYFMPVKYSIADLINEAGVGRYQWRVFALCFCVALLDGFDTQAIAYTGPAILQYFELGAGQLAPILIAGTFGMAVGAMGLGSLGDRWGRRPVVLGAVLIFGLATTATAFAQQPQHILALRFQAGLGMGGATPVLLALAAEFSPARRRGSVLTGILLGLPAGAMLGGILAARMIPIIGWQGIFLVGGVLPLALWLVLFFALPESLQFSVARRGSRGWHTAVQRLSRVLGRSLPEDLQLTTVEREVQPGVSSLFAKGLARNTVSLWLTYLFNWVAWFMFLSWLPTVLKAGGLAAASAPMGSVVVNAVFIVCAIPLSMLLPKANTRNVLLALFALGIAVSIGLSLAGSNWALVFVLIGGAGLGIGCQQIALNYLVVSAYPTALRATATGWAIGIGRVGAIAGSAGGGLFLEWGGAAGFFLALVVPLVVATVAVLLIKPLRGEGVHTPVPAH
jgi:AAHS family 4-hydroxybenzoate transporter-like MFS transporter